MPKRKKTTAPKEEATKETVKKAKPENVKSKYFSNSTDTSECDAEVLSSKSVSDSDRLPFSFYDIPCADLAKSLLGQKLVHVVNKKRLTGVIVETEAYLGRIDKGAHSYEGKRTAKNEAMFMPPGTAYVYNIHMYCCMNISAKGNHLKQDEMFENNQLKQDEMFENNQFPLITQKRLNNLQTCPKRQEHCRLWSYSKEKYLIRPLCF